MMTPAGLRRPAEHILSLACVLAEEVYRGLGSPILFHPFRDGYCWNRNRGESYWPLYSSDQPKLNDLCRDLFPG
jgi:hypothetical protein